MAADRVLLDTNLLVAASVREHPSHAASHACVEELTRQRTPICITTQVCREFMVVMTRKPIGPRLFSVEEALRLLQMWRASCVVVTENDLVFVRWLALVEDFNVKGKQIHDAHIVAAMLTHGITRIATWNSPDFERYSELIQIEAVVS